MDMVLSRISDAVLCVAMGGHGAGELRWGINCNMGAGYTTTSKQPKLWISSSQSQIPQKRKGW